MADAHLALEREVLAALHPESDEPDAVAHGMRTREAALLMLSRCAQDTVSIAELQTEAGGLAATALDVELFAVCELDDRGQRISQRLGIPGDADHGVFAEMTCEVCPDGAALAHAISADQPVVIADLVDETRFSDDHLAEEGVRSGIVCPVSYGDRKYGAIGVFTTVPHEFTREDVLFVQSLALLLGPTTAHQRAEKALVDQTRFLASTIDSLESIVLLLNKEGEILRFNRACQELGGFALEELRLRSFSGAFLLPEEVGLVQSSLERLREGETNPKCETFLLNKTGQRRRVSWSFSSVPFQSDDGLATIVSGIDITQQHNALQRLDQLQATIENFQPAPNALRPLADASSTADTSDNSGKPGIERRAHRRRAYPYVQTIGPVRDGRLPARHEFREVRCRDISPRGFSFVIEEAPDFLELVVTFGAPPSLLFLQARIVHVSPMLHEGRDMLLVGCEYLQKVEIT